MSLHRLFLFTLVTLPLAAHAACSASNGEAIPNEVRDAGELDSGGDFLPDGAPKPEDDSGGTNEDSGESPKDSGAKDAPADSAVSNTIVINEVYVANNGDGDNAEYVELRGTPQTLLGNLKLRLLDSTGQVKYEVSIEANAMFPNDGIFAIGGALALVDQSVSVANWGLDNTRGAVQLVRGPNNELLDVVGWAKQEDAGALPAPATPPNATVEGKPVVIPTIAGHSFGRKAGAADTNDNSADFCSMEKSASNAQKACDP